MVVVLEDVHQADPSSMQTVDHIATVLERLRVLVLATLRPSQDATSSASLANLARQRFATSIVLQGLSRSEVETLLRELSDPRLPIGASEIVFDASAGNPFLLTQIVTIARSRSAVKERSDLSNLPTAVRAAISAQARDLPENCVHTLRVASILGRAFDMRVLAEVMRLEILDVSRYLAPGIQASLIRPSKTPGVLEFSHALLREALYEENDPHSRAQLHLSAGVAMLRILGKECDDQLPSVALHFREAALVGGRDQAISLLERCGDLAHRNLAFADAANFLSDALELRKGQAQRDLPSEVNVLLSLGSARLCSGDRGGARQALITAAEVAAGFGGLAQVSEAAFRLSPGVLSLEVGVVDRALIALIERALSAVGHDHESMRLALMGRLALALYWSDDDARRGELVRALRDETISDPVDRLSSILFAIGADWGPDTLSDRRALLDEVHSRRHMLNSQLGVVTRVFRVATFLESGCLDLMDREVESLETELARAGMPYGAWYPLMFRTTQALIRGEYDRATRCAGEYLRTGSRFEDANVLHSFGAQIAEIEWLRGRAGVALESGRQFAERFASMAEWRCILPFFLSIEGRRAEAEESLRRLAAREFEAVRRSSGWTLAMCALAEACSRLRLSEWAPVLYEQLLPFRGQNAVVGLGVVSWGSVSRFLGLLAHLSGLPRDSEDLLEEAIQADSTAGAPSWIARSELAMAIVLSRQGTRGKSERAKSLARRACERARAIGAIQIEKDAREAGLISRRS
jgi:hypothetical protein